MLHTVLLLALGLGGSVVFVFLLLAGLRPTLTALRRQRSTLDFSPPSAFETQPVSLIPTDPDQPMPLLLKAHPARRPPRRRRYLDRRVYWGMAVVITLVGAGLGYHFLGPGSDTNAATLAQAPLATQHTGFLFVNANGRQVIFLQVNAEVSNITGNWLEVDASLDSHGVFHVSPLLKANFTYQLDMPVVRLIMTSSSTPLIYGTVTGTINANSTQITLTLPANPATGLIPPPAVFHAASANDWNCARNRLADTYFACS